MLSGMSHDTPEASAPKKPAAGAPDPAAPAATTPAVTAAPAVPVPPVGLTGTDVDVLDEVTVTDTTVVVGPSVGARLGAEAFGTFLLVLAGLGTALWASYTGAQALGVALAFGFALVAGTIAVGHVSGGHFNPAVTLGAAISGRTRWVHVLPYWLAQVVGGAFASAVIFVVLSSFQPLNGNERVFFSGVSNGYGAHSPLAQTVQATDGFGLLGALLIEAVVTALLVGVILGATDRRASHAQAPFAMGLMLTVGMLITLPVTNGGLNPARSIAGAIFAESWAWGELWVFIVAPLVGAALAGLLYRAFASVPVEDDLLGEDELVLDEEIEVERA